MTPQHLRPWRRIYRKPGAVAVVGGVPNREGGSSVYLMTLPGRHGQAAVVTTPVVMSWEKPEARISASKRLADMLREMGYEMPVETEVRDGSLDETSVSAWWAQPFEEVSESNG